MAPTLHAVLSEVREPVASALDPVLRGSAGPRDTASVLIFYHSSGCLAAGGALGEEAQWMWPQPPGPSLATGFLGQLHSRGGFPGAHVGCLCPDGGGRRGRSCLLGVGLRLRGGYREVRAQGAFRVLG